MRVRARTRTRLLGAGLVVAAATLSVAVLRAQLPARQEMPRGANVLFGQVIDAGTHAPIAGAVVTIVGYFDAAGRPESGLPRTIDAPGASAPRRVLTSGEGHFFFRDLPAGRYTMVAQAFGYVERNYPPVIVEVNDGAKPTSVSLRIERFAAISGTVFDERGEPVVGASVHALHRELIGGALVLQQSYIQAVTDDRGMYRLSNLTPGSYVVGVPSGTTALPASLAADIDAAASDRTAAGELRSQLLLAGLRPTDGEGVRAGSSVFKRSGPVPPPGPDGRMLVYLTSFFPSTSTPSEATLITVGSGEQRAGVDVPLRLAPAVRVSGVAAGPDGPMAVLAIHLVPDGAADVHAIEPLGVATAVTDAGGAFTFPAVAPGRYTLKATRFTGELFAADEISLWDVRRLTIGDSDITDLAVSMKPGIVIRGRVEFMSAMKPPPNPPRGSPVILRPLGASSWRTSGTRATADWTFHSGGDPPGRYFVLGSAAGWSLQAVSLGGRPLADDVIELERSDLSDLVLTFSDTPTRLSGSVIDAAGTAGAATLDTEIFVFPADTALWREGIFSSRRVRQVRASSAGAFEFTDLAPGEYYVVAVGRRHTVGRLDPAFLERLTAGAVQVTIGGGEARTVELKTFTPRQR